MKEQIEKQAIEEMAKFIKESCAKTPCFQDEKPYTDCDVCAAIYLYSAGYRKQSEGEWKQKEFWEGGGTWRCTECKRQIMFLHGTPKTENMNFCPGCGAKMKGGAE